MLRLLARLKSLLGFKRVGERCPDYLSDAELINQATQQAMERFPNDRVHLEAEAESQLYLRRLLGRRSHDA